MGPSGPPGLASLTLGFQAHATTPVFLFFNTDSRHQTQVFVIVLQVLCLQSCLSSPAWIDSWLLSPCISIKNAPYCLKPAKIRSFLATPAASPLLVLTQLENTLACVCWLVSWNRKSKMVSFVSLVGSVWLLLGTLILLTASPAHSTWFSRTEVSGT